MMSDRYIQAMLRAATEAEILDGWYQYGFGSLRRYVVAPLNYPTITHDVDHISRYCELLAEYGIEPLYVDHQPENTH